MEGRRDVERDGKHLHSVVDMTSAERGGHQRSSSAMAKRAHLAGRTTTSRSSIPAVLAKASNKRRTVSTSCPPSRTLNRGEKVQSRIGSGARTNGCEGS